MSILWIRIIQLILSLFLILSGSHAVYIKAKGTPLRRLNPRESTIIEWTILQDDRLSDVTHGLLEFRHGITLLSEYYLDTRTRSNVSVQDSDPNLQFYNSAIGVYGYRIASARVLDAGEYSCTYREYADFPGKYGDNVTVFVFAPPTTPTIIPQTPIMKGHDVNFLCMSQSQSQPASLRPDMLITWTKNGNRVSGTRYSTDGANLIIHKIDEREKEARIECEAKEDGSRITTRSESFTIALITIQDIELSDSVEPKETTRLAWYIRDLPDPPPDYNHSLVYSHNGVVLGEYDLRYRHWEPAPSISSRSAYYSPGAGQLGFSLYDTGPEDIGEYRCTYTDEFGTKVTSDGLKLKVKGYTYPTFPITTPTTPRVITLTPHTDAPNADGHSMAPPQPAPSNSNPPRDMTLVVGSTLGAGFGCLFLLLLILIPIIVCQRRKREPTNLINAQNTGAGTLGGNSCGRPRDELEGDRYSIYNDIRNSLMVPDDVIIAGPSLPARDDTYNQAFEDTRAKPARQFSVPQCQASCSTLPANASRSPGVVDNKRKMIRSLTTTEYPDVIENEYLTPLSIKQSGEAVRYCNTEPTAMACGMDAMACAGGSQTDDVDQDIYTPRKEPECGYLQMGPEKSVDAPVNDTMGNPYTVMNSDKGFRSAASMNRGITPAATAGAAASEDSGIVQDSEYINSANVANDDGTKCSNGMEANVMQFCSVSIRHQDSTLP